MCENTSPSLLAEQQNTHNTDNWHSQSINQAQSWTQVANRNNWHSQSIIQAQSWTRVANTINWHAQSFKLNLLNDSWLHTLYPLPLLYPLRLLKIRQPLDVIFRIYIGINLSGASFTFSPPILFSGVYCLLMRPMYFTCLFLFISPYIFVWRKGTFELLVMKLSRQWRTYWNMHIKVWW